MISYKPMRNLLICSVLFFTLIIQGKRSPEASGLFDCSGEIEYDFVDHYHTDELGGSNTWNELTFFPQLKYIGRCGYDFFAEGFFRKNYTYEERSRYTLREVYTAVYVGFMDLKVGKQIISWGVADEIRLADYFKRWDYTDVLRKENEGVPAARVTWYLPRSSLDFVWAPCFDSHRVSFDPQNPWSGLSSERAILHLNSAHKPARTLKSSQYGLRFEHRAEGIDFAFTYIYGFDRFPTSVKAEVAGSIENTPRIEILPYYRRIHVFEMDWNKSFSTWNLKGEISYVNTDDDFVDPYIKGVVGIERYFTHLWRTTELFALVQLATDQFLGDADKGDLLNGIDYNHIFTYAATANFDLKFSESYHVSLKGIMDMENSGCIVQAELQWNPQDSFVVYLGVDCLRGKEGTYFGALDKNDRILSGLRLNF